MLVVMVIMTMRVGIVVMVIVIMRMIVRVLMSLMVMRVVVMISVGVRMFAVGFGCVEAFRMFLRRPLRRIGLRRLRGIAAGVLDDVALDAVAMAAPARIAMTRKATRTHVVEE